MTRRQLLAAGLAALPGLRCPAAGAAGKKRLGMVVNSYGVRLSADRKNGSKDDLNDPLVFLEHCHRLGAGGIQLGIGSRDKAYTARLREKLAAYHMYLEGSIGLPRDRKDVERFTAEVRAAKDAGATVLRTVLLGGRRYETFATAAAFRRWADQAFRSLGLAEPVVARHDMQLAVENHKDLRTEELTAVLKRLDSRHVGVCVDTGNSIALLEDALEVVEALAPWAFSTHLKDMAVAEYDNGFLLAEVPLGQGFLDLKKIVAILRRSRPEVRLNLEMITRDPLKVPCLTPRYWATFESLPGRHLARTLTTVRKHRPHDRLPNISGLPHKQQLAAEEDNVRKCMAYAEKYLEF
jgi:sugar phosphate isomerase/epimerase